MTHGISTRTLAASLMTAALIWTAPAQGQTSGTEKNSAAARAAAHAQAQSETRVSAQMVKGNLNPAKTKPGDEIAVRLTEDAKADGRVLLKKGSAIKGVVKRVHRAENKSNAKANGAAQSMIELEWLTPGVSGAASQSLQFALQSVVYTNPLYAQQQESSESPAFSPPVQASRPGRSSGGLGLGAVGGVVGGATSSVGAVGGTSVGAVTQGHAGVGGVRPVSPEVSASLQNSLGVSGAGLVHVGSGQAISSGGTATSMEIFSHMSNDAVITSPSRDFEVSSGAQMQFLVQAAGQK